MTLMIRNKQAKSVASHNLTQQDYAQKNNQIVLFLVSTINMIPTPPQNITSPLKDVP
jgi:hypothetical protein